MRNYDDCLTGECNDWDSRRTEQTDHEWPDGVWFEDGQFVAECCGCGKTKPIPDPVEDIPQTGYRHYCGASPRCCP